MRYGTHTLAKSDRGDIFRISKDESLALKGLALLLLLWHHLFFVQRGKYIDIAVGRFGLVQETGILAKVCVAIFVFLSGYGLTIQYSAKELRPKEFFVRRFMKLFFTFWLIWLLFVPIGFIFYDYTLEGVYGEWAIPKMVLQFFGLQKLLGFPGVNTTWWFYTCIIMLYLCFPLLNALNDKWLIVSTIISLALLSDMYIFIYVSAIKYYLIAFICGMWIARFSRCDAIKSPTLSHKLARLRPYIDNYWLWLGMVGICVIWRRCGFMIQYEEVDFALATAIVMLFKTLPVLPDWIIVALVFLGRHSMNIFLFHTFVYYYYWEDLIFWSRNPLLIFVTLLLVCLVISIAINWISSIIRNTSIGH